ncbi:MAG: hypothetical protein KA170_20100 [Candidatus Promineofilum sp.]|nr:hypothetical protein [Promineifilum sp.]
MSAVKRAALPTLAVRLNTPPEASLAADRCCSGRDRSVKVEGCSFDTAFGLSLVTDRVRLVIQVEAIRQE